MVAFVLGMSFTVNIFENIAGVILDSLGLSNDSNLERVKYQYAWMLQLDET